MLFWPTRKIEFFVIRIIICEDLRCMLAIAHRRRRVKVPEGQFVVFPHVFFDAVLTFDIRSLVAAHIFARRMLSLCVYIS